MSASKRTVCAWVGLGALALVMSASGDCYRNPDLGIWKLVSAIAGVGCFAQAIAEADAAEQVELVALDALEQDRQLERDRSHIQRMKLLEMEKQEAEAELQVHQVLAEGKAEKMFYTQTGIKPGQYTATIEPPVQPLPAQAAVAEPVAPINDAVVAPVVVPNAPAAIAQPVQPLKPQPVTLPDGAKLIEASDIADINQYPVVFVVAVPGSGKTVTVQYVISQLPGKRVLCSHKAEAYHRNMFDVVFGYNPHTGKSRWIGDDSIIQTDDRDFTYVAEHQQGYGNLAEGYWALFAEISNRQQLGPTKASQLEVYRNFYDESSYAYSTAFQQPLNPELLRWGQNLVSSTNKVTFFDARTNGNQIFFAAQSDSVEIIGLKGLSKARDEMWFLYPGRSAIAYATQQGKQQLANWLTSRLSQGYAVALMVKQDTFWHVINMPKVADLIAWENSFKTVQPIAVEETSAADADIYDLVKQVKHGVAA